MSINIQVRNWVMPINRKYNLGLLLGTLRDELCLKHKYKVLFEYVMLAGVNDRSDIILIMFFWCLFTFSMMHCTIIDAFMKIMLI